MHFSEYGMVYLCRESSAEVKQGRVQHYSKFKRVTVNISPSLILPVLIQSLICYFTVRCLLRFLLLSSIGFDTNVRVFMFQVL